MNIYLGSLSNFKNYLLINIKSLLKAISKQTEILTMNFIYNIYET